MLNLLKKIELLLVTFAFTLSCSKAIPEATSRSGIDSIDIDLSQSSTYLIGVSESGKVTVSLSCQTTPYDIEYLNPSKSSSWKSLRKSINNFNVPECIEEKLSLEVDASVLLERNSSADVSFRLGYLFGYSAPVDITIIWSSDNPQIVLNTPPIHNKITKSSVLVDGTCNIDDAAIKLHLINSQPFSINQLDSISLQTTEALCDSGNFSVNFAVSELSGNYKIVAKFDELSEEEASVAVSDIEIIAVAAVGLSWDNAALIHTILEEVDLNNAYNPLRIEASHPDPTMIIQYELVSSTCGDWSEKVSLASYGEFTGKPDGYAASNNINEEVCLVRLRAITEFENLEKDFTLEVRNNFCSSGSPDSVCRVSSNVTLPNGFFFYGSGDYIIDPGIELDGAPLESAFFSIGGSFTVNGNVKSNIEITADIVSVNASGTIDASGKGHIGLTDDSINEGKGGGHAGAGGGVDCVISTDNKIGFSAYGNIDSANSFGGAGQAGTASGQGGFGGGKVVITATELEVEGDILATGFTAIEGGGGAGGSIRISADLIHGTGSLDSSGGHANSTGSSSFGGGAGGYINVSAINSQHSGPVLALGGRSSYSNSSAGTFGEEGVIQIILDNICDTGTYSDTCRITSEKNLTSIDITLNNLELSSSAGLKNPQNTSILRLSLSGELVVSSGAMINSSVEVQADGSVTIDGEIDASELGAPGGGGCQTGFGLSGGVMRNQKAGGGAHRSAGGKPYEAFSGLWGTAAPAYGSDSTPNFGSGGGGGIPKNGSALTHKGGSGGGIIKLVSGSNIEINGLLSANGGSPYDDLSSPSGLNNISGGGGAGGYIELNGASLSGAGSIFVNGGEAGGGDFDSSSNPGAGGGGYGAFNDNGLGFPGTVEINRGLNGW